MPSAALFSVVSVMEGIFLSSPARVSLSKLDSLKNDRKSMAISKRVLFIHVRIEDCTKKYIYREQRSTSFNRLVAVYFHRMQP